MPNDSGFCTNSQRTENPRKFQSECKLKPETYNRAQLETDFFF